MPDIDVSDILLDPDFVESITVNRQMLLVDDSGRGVLQPQAFDGVFASVIPQSDQPIQRGPDQANLPRLIQVITQFRLQGPAKDVDGNDYQPDQIVWNGDAYVVNKVYDFSHYGAGFIGADCSSLSSVEMQPQAQAGA